MDHSDNSHKSKERCSILSHRNEKTYLISPTHVIFKYALDIAEFPRKYIFLGNLCV